MPSSLLTIGPPAFLYPPRTLPPLPPAQLELTERQACDVELLTVGGFTPLDGFMNEDAYRSVVDKMRWVGTGSPVGKSQAGQGLVGRQSTLDGDQRSRDCRSCLALVRCVQEQSGAVAATAVHRWLLLLEARAPFAHPSLVPHAPPCWQGAACTPGKAPAPPYLLLLMHLPACRSVHAAGCPAACCLACRW